MAPDYSGLDATCFRLARLTRAGVLPIAEPLAPAIAFLVARQHPDGSWREEPPSGWLPPWLAHENPTALAYLTANGGYWLCQTDPRQEACGRAAQLLASLMGPAMREAAPLQTLAQSAVIFHATRYDTSSRAMLAALAQRLAETIPAGALSWALAVLVDSGEWVDRSLISTLCAYLIRAQRDDGSWSSEDGPDAAVHVTLEALWGLRMGGQW
jgi:prenyltransferase/squalene oxidase-like repeat protein